MRFCWEYYKSLDLIFIITKARMIVEAKKEWYLTFITTFASFVESVTSRPEWTPAVAAVFHDWVSKQFTDDSQTTTLYMSYCRMISVVNGVPCQYWLYGYAGLWECFCFTLSDLMFWLVRVRCPIYHFQLRVVHMCFFVKDCFLYEISVELHGQVKCSTYVLFLFYFNFLWLCN